mgnify:CR=1 FL=1
MRGLRPNDVYGLWRVVEKTSRHYGSKPLYKCLCLKCGNVSYLVASNIIRSRGRNCKNCTPNYHFRVVGGVANGILPDGSHFQISSADMEAVSKYRWYMSTDTGYISTTQFENHQTALHRFILGLRHEDGYVVDHINRIKTDCRRENLRIVTVAQNTLNKSLRHNSLTGFKGVSSCSKSIYKAIIYIQHKEVRLGTSQNPEECAQMYNHACDLLYGTYSGHRNDVPDASAELKRKVQEICQPYIFLAQNVTQPVTVLAV